MVDPIEHVVQLERLRLRRQLLPLISRLESPSLTPVERATLVAKIYWIIR